MRRLTAPLALLIALWTATTGARFSSTTPTIGQSPGLCEQPPDKLVTPGLPVMAYVQLISGATVVWTDSVATQAGAEWTLARDVPSGTFTLAHWYRVASADGASGCSHAQTMTVIQCAPSASTPLRIEP